MKLKSFLVAGAMLLAQGIVAENVYFEYESDGVKLGYELVEGGAELVCGVENAPETLIIPSYVTYEDATFPVVSIGEDAFRCDLMIARPYDPDRYSTDDGFNIRAIHKVVIPPTVTRIGAGAFYRERYSANYTQVSEVEIPESVTYIGDEAFYGNELTELTLPNSLKYIGDYAFYGSAKLMNITLPKSLEHLGSSVFAYCKELKTVKLGEQITEIGINPFQGCNNLESFTGKLASADNRLLVVDDNVISFAPGGLTEYTIPDGITAIGMNAFFGSSIESISLGNSVTTLYQCAFTYCYNLQKVDFGKSLETIGVAAFLGCASLTDAQLPDGLKTIGTDAFYKCDNLKSINIPETVSTLGVEAFADCSSLVEIKLPDSVTIIPDNLFNGCSKLEEARFGSNVSSFGETVFAYCNSLKTVSIATPTPPVATVYSFGGYWPQSSCSLYVPEESVELYKSATGWSDFGAYIGFNVGIGAVEGDVYGQADTYFDLMGRKVDNPSHGIYIKNGRKVFVR